MMVKVLIYSSKEIYDNASFEGRAEADIIAYREGEFYHVIKNRTSEFIPSMLLAYTMPRYIKWAERKEWEDEIRNYKLVEEYKKHPYIELSKNAEVAQR